MQVQTQSASCGGGNFKIKGSGHECEDAWGWMGMGINLSLLVDNVALDVLIDGGQVLEDLHKLSGHEVVVVKGVCWVGEVLRSQHLLKCTPSLPVSQLLLSQPLLQPHCLHVQLLPGIMGWDGVVVQNVCGMLVTQAGVQPGPSRGQLSTVGMPGLDTSQASSLGVDPPARPAEVLGTPPQDPVLQGVLFKLLILIS